MRLHSLAANFDSVPSKVLVTADPPAGTVSVDVMTCTHLTRLEAISVTCLADGTTADRRLTLYKVTSAGTIMVSQSGAFAANTTGYMYHARGYQGGQQSGYAALAEMDFSPGDIIRVVVINGQAGDNMSAITISYKEL